MKRIPLWTIVLTLVIGILACSFGQATPLPAAPEAGAASKKVFFDNFLPVGDKCEGKSGKKGIEQDGQDKQDVFFSVEGLS